MTGNEKQQKGTERSRSRGIIRCTSEVRGKQVRSIYVSGVDQFNVVNIDFTDGTALTVQIIPAARLRVEFNDWTTGDGKLLKQWPVITTR